MKEWLEFTEAGSPAEAAPSTEEASPGSVFAGRTLWGRDTPLRSFLRTETGSASVLAAATIAA